MFNPGLSRALAVALVAIAMLFGTVPAQAQQPSKELTPRASVADLAPMKKFYHVPNFRIGGKYDLNRPDSWAFGGEGGTTLESLGAGPLRLGYIAVGTPQRNAKGEITNAIIVSSYYSGDATDMYNFWVEGQKGTKYPFSAVHVGKGKLFDTDRYYVVFLDALGLWGASKPSDGLGVKFPQYNMFDLVQANYRLLRDHLKIAQVELATGVSMGGTQTYIWGVLHSADGFVKNIMPVGGTTQSAGEDPVGEWIFQLMTAAIESDPVWRETKGNYYHLPKDKHPNQGVMFGWSMLSHTGFDLDFRANTPWSIVEKEVFYWDAKGNEGAALKAKAAMFDAADLIYRNRAGNPVNLNKELGRIKARTLVLHVENDQWLMNDFAKKSARNISGAQYASITDKFAHYAVFREPASLKEDPLVNAWFRDIGIIADPDKKFVAKNFQPAKVVMDGNPAAPFWKSQVVYPFPVKFTTGKDSKGINWQIGYMDEYAGNEKNPTTLVIIHGKGAFGAHYGYLMKYALERGLRVIVPDLPHYGMSAAGNLDKPMGRSLDQCREAVYDVVVNKLGVKKAYYLGHSLGAQVILGYALKYPNAVQGLVLEGPAGLEEVNRVGPGALNLHDPSYIDFEKWNAAWAPTGILDAEINKTPEQVRDFFEWKGAKGYFKLNTEYARLHTDQRIAIINGNPKEKEQYLTAFIYDVWAMTTENIVEDPNALNKRIKTIKAPIFLQFGSQEPFMPATPFNGKTSIAKDIIIPFKEKMTAAGNPPVIKMYPGVGHFLHTDRPYEYAKDTVDFIKTGKPDLQSRDAIVSLMEGGAPVAAAAPAAAAQPAAKPAGLSK